MEELKTVQIELISLKNDSTLMLVEYLNEKNEPCMRTDKIRVHKIKALLLTYKLIKRFEEDYPQVNINLKHSL